MPVIARFYGIVDLVQLISYFRNTVGNVSEDQMMKYPVEFAGLGGTRSAQIVNGVARRFNKLDDFLDPDFRRVAPFASQARFHVQVNDAKQHCLENGFEFLVVGTVDENRAIKVRRRGQG